MNLSLSPPKRLEHLHNQQHTLKNRANMNDLISVFQRRNHMSTKSLFSGSSGTALNSLQYANQSPLVHSTSHQMYSITKGPRFSTKAAGK